MGSRSKSLPLSTALGGMAAVGVVTWTSTPAMLSLWRSSTQPPAAVEAQEKSVYYAGCNEARDAGAAPIYRGSPGYRPEMDGDNDGIACEPRRY